MTLKILYKDIGRLQVITGSLLIFPLVVSLLYSEFYSAVAFLLSGLATILIGLSVYWFCRKAPALEARHGLLVAALGWLNVAVFGALPFFIAALITPAEVAQSFVPVSESFSSSLFDLKNPLNAFFESMSAYTTTGLTMIVHEPSVGNGILFYRSFGQWIGGAGVIVLALAILRRPSGSQVVSLFASEHGGEKLKPNVLGTARVVWKVYLTVTIMVAVYLTLGTLLILPEYGFFPALFDSINHAMTGQSTGGFSVLDDSIAGYGSRSMELLYLLPMLLGAISIAVYYKAIDQRTLKVFWRDIQFKLLLIFFVIGIPILVFFLLPAARVGDPLTEGLFQYVSGLSTTGWQTSDIAGWPPEAVIFIVTGAMVIGGSVGATVGGIKIIRAYWILWAVRWRVLRPFLPMHVVQTARIGGKVLNLREINSELAHTSIFGFMYILLVLAGSIVTVRFMGEGFTLADAIFESASAQGTVGLSTGITEPKMSWFLKSFYIVQMWMGRLEIIPVLVLIRSFWGIRARRI